jgi:hypothetical protein
MKFRKLRIAWSVFWALACMLLIVLWVRSYWQRDVLTACLGTKTLLIQSNFGRILVGGTPIDKQWEYSSHEALPLPMQHESKMGFGNVQLMVGTLHAVPHWFCVLLLGTLVAIPWIPIKRRFSLRTLLIATTIFALFLGLVIYASH